MLRLLRAQCHRAGAPSPRVLGIDEWAWKKGHRYGTILCDLEARRVVDLLPTRDVEAVATWLRQHPTVKVVSRDRAGAFAAIAKGAPSASQPADRWHLLNNLLETLIALLERHRGVIREARESFRGEDAEPAVFHESEAARTTALQRKAQNRQRRIDLYQRMRALMNNGQSQTQAASLGLGLRTVRQWVACGDFQDAKHRAFSNQVDAFGPYLQKRVAEAVVRRWSSGERSAGKVMEENGQRLGMAAPSLRRSARQADTDCRSTSKKKISALLGEGGMADVEGNSSEKSLLNALYRASTELKFLARAARSFFEMIRNAIHRHGQRG